MTVLEVASSFCFVDLSKGISPLSNNIQINPKTSAGLLAIGNELLNGEVRDKNLFTLSQALTRLGIVVELAVIVRDDPDAIAALLDLMLHEPSAYELDILIVSGGLGPTQDDLTLAALAQALQLPLVENKEARRLVEVHYERFLKKGYLAHHGPETARRKMATLPRGATPLPNPVGTAPGVRLEYSAANTNMSTLIYCLPGVPAELEAIFADTIEPELRAHFTTGVWRETSLLAICDDEASAAAPLHEVAERHPDVYLKSLARPFPAAHREGLRIVLATHAHDAAEAQSRLDQVEADLRQAFNAVHICVEDATLSADSS
jgi:molybdenum cofactor synthesis domain-containing protein